MKEGIRNAATLAERKNLGGLCRFEQCDVSQSLPFAEETFDTVFSNDVLCHVPRRLELLGEIFRVLKPRGRLLFSDALVVGGMISHEEIAMRSSIGRYFFSPPGENEKLLERAGLQLVCARDTTEAAAAISERWRDAREKRKADFMTVEGEANFKRLQRFLDCVHKLCSERRLQRFLYVAGSNPRGRDDHASQKKTKNVGQESPTHTGQSFRGRRLPPSGVERPPDIYVYGSSQTSMTFPSGSRISK